MAAWAPSIGAESSPALGARARPRATAASPQRRLAGGVLWIVVLGVLLVGVVALNVAVLRLNMQLERLSERRLALEAENALLAARVSAALAPGRTEELAQTTLGLVPADPAYVELPRQR